MEVYSQSRFLDKFINFNKPHDIMTKIIDLYGYGILIEGKRYPASYKITDVDVLPNPEKLSCVYSKTTGKLLFPDYGSHRERGAHINQCKEFVGEHTIVTEIKPGTANFAVYRMKGSIPWRKLYPDHTDFGDDKESCERWIMDSCARPGDKPFRKDFLEKLLSMHPGSSLEGIIIIENAENIFEEPYVVFKEEEIYYKFHFAGKNSPIWLDNIDKNHILCRNVHPKEKTVIEFTDEAPLSN